VKAGSSLSALLGRFARGAPGERLALAYDPTTDPSIPRDSTALVRSMRSSADPAARKQLARLRSIYAGADVNRLTGDFKFVLRSPDMELRQDLRVLRSRARQLTRDNPHAKKFVRELIKNVIGPKGIRLRARHVTTDSTTDIQIPHTRANTAIEDGWVDFKRHENAVASRDMTLDQFSAMVLATVATDGEAFIHRLKGFPNDHGYALDLIDPDQFDETYFRYQFSPGQGPNEIRMGVEIDQWGAATAYWPWKRHPSEYASQERIRLPASEVFHIFVRERARQTRGVTWFAPVLLALQMYDGYQQSELVASRGSAAKMGFFETDPTKGGSFVSATEPNAAEDLNDQGIEIDAEPGTFESLPPGVTFKPYDPQHPTAQYEAFSRAVMMSVAAGLDISYAAQTGDLSRANYSSMREGKTSERDGYEMIQQFMTDKFYRPVYEDWLPMAMLNEQVKLPTFDAKRWRDVQFLARGWSWVDPWKDAQATSLLIAMGMTSHVKACAEMGVDLEENIKEIALCQALQKKYGVILSLDTRLTDTPGAGGSEDTAAKPGQDDPATSGAGGGMGNSALPGPIAVRVGLNGANHVTLERTV
jgi:lambda family phage portal protein